MSSNHRITVSLPIHVYDQLVNAAAAREMSASYLVNQALKDFLPRLIPVEQLRLTRDEPVPEPYPPLTTHHQVASAWLDLNVSQRVRMLSLYGIETPKIYGYSGVGDDIAPSQRLADIIMNTGPQEAAQFVETCREWLNTDEEDD